jgi:hypothetical protein
VDCSATVTLDTEHAVRFSVSTVATLDTERAAWSSVSAKKGRGYSTPLGLVRLSGKIRSQISYLTGLLPSTSTGFHPGSPLSTLLIVGSW